MVSPASRMLRAISFGVFCRSAPSTRAIIRSRKVWPGRAVIRTTSSSESTRVPPVTAERSPPDSRITGADSPVMADSSTEATPSITSPSLGMTSPAETTTMSSRSSAVAATTSMDPSGLRRLAVVWVRVRRSESAWAFPRPSAIASAKLAKRTVNQSQSTTWPANEFSAPVGRAEVAQPDDGGEHRPDLDDQHHRVAHHVARVEFAEGVSRGSAHDRRVETSYGACHISVLLKAEVLDDGPESPNGEEGQAGHHQDHPDEKPGEEGPVGGEGPCRSGNGLLARPASRRCRAPG